MAIQNIEVTSPYSADEFSMDLHRLHLQITKIWEIEDKLPLDTPDDVDYCLDEVHMQLCLLLERFSRFNETLFTDYRELVNFRRCRHVVQVFDLIAGTYSEAQLGDGLTYQLAEVWPSGSNVCRESKER